MNAATIRTGKRSGKTTLTLRVNGKVTHEYTRDALSTEARELEQVGDCEVAEAWRSVHYAEALTRN